MPAEKGSAFLLKVGDGSPTPVYATVAGLRTTQASINGEAVVITNKGSGGWRELLSGAGVRSVSVSGSGVFTGSAAETRLKNNALAGLIDDYELSFESGERGLRAAGRVRCSRSAMPWCRSISCGSRPDMTISIISLRRGCCAMPCSSAIAG